MERRYGEDTLYGGGLRIYTTLDLGMQKAAYDAVTGTLNQPGDPAGAIVAIDDQGQVRAMMGGRGLQRRAVEGEPGHRAAGGGTGRQPGSTFKAFALAEAISEGYSIDSHVQVAGADRPSRSANDGTRLEGATAGAAAAGPTSSRRPRSRSTPSTPS